MTISSTVNRVTFTGNGVTTAFAFAYPFLANGDLRVYQAGVLKTITTHYTVSGAGDPAGGTVTFLVAPANGESVVIFRDPALTQLTDLVNNDPFPPESVEQAHDKAAMIAQRLQDQISRSLRLSDTDISGATVVLPTPEASKLLGWNVGGTGIINVGAVDNTLLAQQLLDTASITNGDAMLGVKRPEAGAVAQTQHDRNLEIATANGFTSFAAAVAAGIKSLFYPAGTYTYAASQDHPTGAGMMIFGAGSNATTIQAQAGSTFDQIFKLGTAAAQCTRGVIMDLKLSGSGATVQAGIYGARVDHWRFVRVYTTGFQRAGIDIGYGWANSFEGGESSYNPGDGIRFNVDHAGGGNNANDILGYRLFNNTLFGARVRSGTGFRLLGGLVEANAAGGIFMDAMSGFKISTYFEANAATGHTFTTPARTIKSDIILCGGGNGGASMGSGFPCKAGTIEGCTTNPTGTPTSFVFDAGATDVTIQNNNLNSGSMTLLAWEYDSQYRGTGITIIGCDSFTTLLSETNVVADKSNTAIARLRLLNAGSGNSSLAKIAKRKNYADTNYLKWQLLAAGSATAFRKSEDAALQTVDGAHVWNLNSTAAGSSEIWGFRIPYSDYANLAGKLVWFGMWKRAVDGTNAFATLYCNVQGFAQSTHASGSWIFEAVSFVWPGAGNVDCGILKQGGGTNQIYFHSPMLMEVGVPLDEAMGTIPTANVWKGAATAPAAGTWPKGARIEDDNANAGAAPAIQCTTGGTGGAAVWKAEQNLAV